MEKIKVLIVDDEILAIEDIIGLFGWQGNGFEVVGTANNGEQVLRKFNKLQPQVVITDINDKNFVQKTSVLSTSHNVNLLMHSNCK